MRLLTYIFFVLVVCLSARGQAVVVIPAPVCASDSSVQLTALVGGGTWGGLADSTGVVDISMGVAGNPYQATYSYIDSTGQMAIDTVDILVNPIPVVQLMPAGPFCESSGIQQLVANPPGGTWGSPDGSTNSAGEFSPFFGANTSPYTAWYTYTDSIGCTAVTDSITIEVLPAPQVTLVAPSVVCATDAPFQVQAMPAGGTWLAGTDSVGIFDPSLSSPGSIQVVYTFTDSSGCSNVSAITISVNGFAIPGGFTIDSLCLGSGVDTIQAIGLAGSVLFSGAADPSGQIDPDSLGPGNHTVNYLTSCISCCPFTDSLTITVVEPTSIALLDSTVCADLDSVLLETNGTVDMWGGVASPAGFVDPLALGVGPHVVFATGADLNGCAASDSLLINVLPRPAASIVTSSPYCTGDLPDTLVISPIGGIWDAPVDSNDVFSLTDTAGVYPISYTYTDSISCTNMLRDTLIVTASPTVSINNPPGFCRTDDPVLLTAQPAGGIWSGGTTSSGIFDPGQALISGTIPVQYSLTDSMGCTGTDSADVVVLLEPEVVFGMNGPYCKGIGLVLLDVNPGLGTWSGDAFPDGTFDGNNEPGIYIANYTINNGLCVVTASDTIIVEDCTSIEEFSSANTRIYPVPANEQLTVDLDEWVNISSLTLTDGSGRVVMTHYPGFVNRIQVNTSSLPNGIYYVRINDKIAGLVPIAH